MKHGGGVGRLELPLSGWLAQQTPASGVGPFSSYLTKAGKLVVVAWGRLELPTYRL